MCSNMGSSRPENSVPARIVEWMGGKSVVKVRRHMKTTLRAAWLTLKRCSSRAGVKLLKWEPFFWPNRMSRFPSHLSEMIRLGQKNGCHFNNSRGFSRAALSAAHLFSLTGELSLSCKRDGLELFVCRCFLCRSPYQSLCKITLTRTTCSPKNKFEFWDETSLKLDTPFEVSNWHERERAKGYI